MFNEWRLPEEEWLAHFPEIELEYWLQLAQLRAESLQNPNRQEHRHPSEQYEVSDELGLAILRQLMEMQLIVDFDYQDWEHRHHYLYNESPVDFDSLDPLTLGKILLVWHRHEHWNQGTMQWIFAAGIGQQVLAALIRKSGNGHLLEK